jgi:hypothetical protein
MPWQRVEVVLGPDQVGPVEQADRAAEGRLVVADVVVGDHDPLVARRVYAGHHAVHLPHREVELGIGG